MVEEYKEKGNDALRISCGVICLVCAVVAVVSIFLLFGVVIANIGDAEGEANLAGLALGAILVGIYYALLVAAVAVSCIVSGILVLVNQSNGKGFFIAAAILALFDAIAVFAILFMAFVTGEGGGGWFAVLAIPFFADAALRITCAVVYSK